MRNGSIRLLHRNPALRALVASRLVSSAGTWLAYVALAVDVFERTRSSAWVSAVLLADFVPSVAVASLAGPWLDRIPRRTLLVGSELAAGLVFAALPFAPSAAAVVGLALVAGIASAVYYPTARAAMPELVTEDELPQANSLSQTAATAGLAAGPVLAGLLVARSGVALAYELNAVSFAVSAALLARLPAPSRAAEARARARRGRRTPLDGIRLFLRPGTARTVISMAFLAGLGGAVINVGEIFLAREAFHSGTVGFGLLASGSGTGLVVGSMLAARIEVATAGRTCRLGLLAITLGFGAAALAPSVGVAAACAFVGGVGNAVFLASATLLVQQSTDEANRGHAFAVFDAAGSIAVGIGMVAGGVLVASLGARGAWLTAAAVVAVAAAGPGLRRRRAGTAALGHARGAAEGLHGVGVAS